jgi:hypothetical protein
LQTAVGVEMIERVKEVRPELEPLILSHGSNGVHQKVGGGSVPEVVAKSGGPAEDIRFETSPSSVKALSFFSGLSASRRNKTNRISKLGSPAPTFGGLRDHFLGNTFNWENRLIVSFKRYIQTFYY